MSVILFFVFFSLYDAAVVARQAMSDISVLCIEIAVNSRLPRGSGMVLVMR